MRLRSWHSPSLGLSFKYEHKFSKMHQDLDQILACVCGRAGKQMDGLGLHGKRRGVLENPGGRAGVGNWVRVKKLTTNIRSSGI